MADEAPLSTQPVLDTLPAAVVIYDADGKISYLNRRARQILVPDGGGPPERVEEAFGFVPHEWLVAGGASEVEQPGAPGRWLGFQVATLNGEGDCGSGQEDADSEAFLVLFQDITRALEERKAHRRFLDVEVMGHLLPSIAHQIVNPLAGMQSLVEVLIEETKHPGHREDLETVLGEIGRIADLVRQLGLAGRDLRSDAQLVDVADVVQRTLETFRPRAAQLDLELTYRGEEHVLDTIDRDGLGYLVASLVTNAIEACRRGDRIFVDLESPSRPSHGDRWNLVVRDTGVGMTAETMEHAADPFFSTKPGSSGIGLTLVREMVERSGGRLSSSSRPGQGTRVEVSFPFLSGS